MSLLISENDTFEIKVAYVQGTNGELKFENGEGSLGPEAKHETFVFRRPNWFDTRIIFSSCVIVDGESGKAIVDPYKMMDVRLKMLLKEWTITKDDGEKVPITAQSIDQLEPLLVEHVHNKLNEALTPKTAEPPKKAE